MGYQFVPIPSHIKVYAKYKDPDDGKVYFSRCSFAEYKDGNFEDYICVDAFGYQDEASTPVNFIEYRVFYVDEDGYVEKSKLNTKTNRRRKVYEAD